MAADHGGALAGLDPHRGGGRAAGGCAPAPMGRAQLLRVGPCACSAGSAVGRARRTPRGGRAARADHGRGGAGPRPGHARRRPRRSGRRGGAAAQAAAEGAHALGAEGIEQRAAALRARGLSAELHQDGGRRRAPSGGCSGSTASGLQGPRGGPAAVHDPGHRQTVLEEADGLKSVSSSPGQAALGERNAVTQPTTTRSAPSLRGLCGGGPVHLPGDPRPRHGALAVEPRR